MWDRFYDLYVNVPVGKIVTDSLRAEGEHDPRGVADAKDLLKTAYGMIEKQLADKTWAIGEEFSLADCAAAPALFFADTLVPFSGIYPNLTAWFGRLEQRPSFRRVLIEVDVDAARLLLRRIGSRRGTFPLRLALGGRRRRV